MFATHRQAVARALLIAAGIELPLLALTVLIGFPAERFTLATWGAMLTQVPGTLVVDALGVPTLVAVGADGMPSWTAPTLVAMGASNLLLFALLAYLPVRAMQRRSRPPQPARPAHAAR